MTERVDPPSSQDKLEGPVVLEMALTFRREHSTAVVWLGRSRGGRRVRGSARSVRLGVGTDALAGLSVDTALQYLGVALLNASKSRGRALAPGTPGGVKGAVVQVPGQQTLDLDLTV